MNKMGVVVIIVCMACYEGHDVIDALEARSSLVTFPALISSFASLNIIIIFNIIYLIFLSFQSPFLAAQGMYTMTFIYCLPKVKLFLIPCIQSLIMRMYILCLEKLTIFNYIMLLLEEVLSKSKVQFENFTETILFIIIASQTNYTNQITRIPSCIVQLYSFKCNKIVMVML